MTKTRRKQRAGIRNNISTAEKANLRSLLSYERDPTRNIKRKNNSLTIKERIERILERQQPLTKPMIVWRGQINTTINNTSWFSTSTHIHVALNYGGNALFKIHLEEGIRVIDLYSFYEMHGIKNPHTEQNSIRNFLEEPNLNLSHNYINFGETIVQGGGTFWKNKYHTQRGFKYVGQIRSRVPPANLPPPTEGQTTIFLKETDYPLIPVYETWYSAFDRGCIVS
jgi:hypothetical protein